MKKIILLYLFIISNALGFSYAFADKQTESVKQVHPANGAVVLLFHRFGEDKYPSTNIRTEQLDVLIKYLIDNEYKVLPLLQILKALKLGDNLPKKTIAITIDDAYKSTFTVAYPKFKEAGFPFTVFLSTYQVNAENPNYMSWTDLIEMSANGVDLQAHTITHSHLVNKDIDTVRQEIEDSSTTILQNTGITPTLFAYPYGETNSEIIDITKQLGFEAGFGQHSGVVGEKSNMFYLPRFSVNENYSNVERLKMVLSTKSFPVSNVQPSNPLITDNNPPEMEFTVDESVGSIKQLACFQSSVGKISLEKNDRTIYLDFQSPFNKGRIRINCTLPAKDGGFRWFGMQYLVK